MFNPVELKKRMDLLNSNLERAKMQMYKDLFKTRIDPNFMVTIFYKIKKKLDFANYYDIKLLGNGNNVGEQYELDVFRQIIGSHRYLSTFMSIADQKYNESNLKYQEQLTNDVIDKIKVRCYASSFFKERQLVRGDEFHYFNLPYYLYTASIYMNSVMVEQREKASRHEFFYSKITEGALSILSLLSDNLLTASYTLCRGFLELTIKFIVASEYGLEDIFEKYSNYDRNKGCCGIKKDSFFENEYNNRKNKKAKTVDFIHFGWVDHISDYHDVISKGNPYSIDALFNYIIEKSDETSSNIYTLLKGFYKMCNCYVHGNAFEAKYPLLHYFEISLMVGCALSVILENFCSEYEVDSIINGVNISEKIAESMEKVVGQYSIRSTEKFEKYYSKR